MSHMSKRTATALVAVLTLSPLGFASVASAAPGALPSTDSPALVSTREATTEVREDGKTYSVAPDALPGFRTLPYLQKAAATEMTINFWTETGAQATVTVSGPGIGTKTYPVSGVQNPVNTYEAHELSQGTLNQPAGKATLTDPLTVPQGSWLRAEDPFKYSVTIDGLEANSDYTYSVEVDGYQHDAEFTTLQGGSLKDLTEPVHIIAYSDTETDPVGRVTYREWVKSPLTEDSEPRPDAVDSQWAQTFGENTRDGEPQLRYMLTEDKAQELNNQMIEEADPDLLIIAGDLAERGSNQSHWDEWFRYFAGDKGDLLDSVPISTSPGNHEVYGYCQSTDDCTRVIRARAQYNEKIDTFGSTNPEHRDAYHRTEMGPLTIISLDSTNGTDQTPATMPESAKMTGDDSNITPEQYGTDTQNSYSIEQYTRDFPKAVEQGWFGPDADPTKPDQPNFMPGTPQYEWLEAQLKDAREKGQTIIVQFHHVAYSNGTHGTTMGHQYSDQQPGTPMRHLQPLFEQYDVATVISGHDETFQQSYVDEAGDGTGVYHWDVGIASDGLRGEKLVNVDGEYVPLRFNSNSTWMVAADNPEKWVTNENGVKHLVEGGKHYGHLDMMLEPYDGGLVTTDGVAPVATLQMTPIAMFPILNDDYSLKTVERREMLNGQATVYLAEDGSVLPTPTEEPAPTPEPTDEPTEEPTDEPTEEPTDEPTAEPTDEPTEEPLDLSPVRLAGKNRIETSVATVNEIAKENGGIDSLLLAGSNGVPDVLTGTALAEQRGTGIAFTRPDALPKATKDLIVEQGVKDVTVLGGTQVVSESVVAELKALGVNVDRIAGKNRYETAIAVAEEVQAAGALESIVLATGEDFADALVAGPLATKHNGVVLLTRNESIPAATRNFVGENSAADIYAVGGQAERLSDSLTGMNVAATYAGANRYETAAALVNAEFTDATTVGLANGRAEADASVAGAYAANLGTGVLLTRQDAVPAVTHTSLKNFDKVVVFGGPQVVSNELYAALN